MNASIHQQLASAGQEHVLRFYDELDDAGRRRLEDQIRDLDLQQITQLTRAKQKLSDWAAMARRSVPPPAFCMDGRDAAFTPQEARQRGMEALHAGKIGAILVAGGQGTRLGFAHSKGTLPIGPVSGHSLFQILIERVLATARRYQASVPLFVMTSPATHAETIDYLEANHRFGLPADDLFIFCQATMPAVDAASGKLLLASRDSLALAPDGHGGMLAALQKSGALQRAHDRGIQQFSYGQIDNPLVQLCQPELIGYHLLASSEMTSQVVRKVDPLARVGNVVMVDDRMRIIEYSDLPEDMAHKRNSDGSLHIWAGSIAVHVFDVAFLDRMAHQSDALPFHLANKKVAYVDADGTRHVPDKPNATKFERFIFDLLPWAQNAVVVEGDPCEVFAPVKNAEGSDEDTPSTAKAAMIRLHARWLRKAGVTVQDGIAVEIGPLWALDAQQVAEKEDLPQRIDRPTYFRGTC